MRFSTPRTRSVALLLGLTLTFAVASAFGGNESASTDASVIANATTASATAAFSIRSMSATSTFTGGACPTQTCNAGAGHCGCETVNGSVIATSIGRGTLVANITSNNDASTPNRDTPA